MKPEVKAKKVSQLCIELKRLRDQKYKDYGRLCDEARAIGEYPSPECKPSQLEFEKKIKEVERELKKLGIKFGCSDYSMNSACLDEDGVRIVIKSLFGF